METDSILGFPCGHGYEHGQKEDGDEHERLIEIETGGRSL